jgi:hypothetical protein
MSTKYKSSKDVPLDAIVARLKELSDAIIQGREAQASEFTMRIPAECDRDADLVLSEAANRINKLCAKVAAFDDLYRALESISFRLQMDIDDGSRPDQRTMESLVKTASSAMSKANGESQ